MIHQSRRVYRTLDNDSTFRTLTLDCFPSFDRRGPGPESRGGPLAALTVVGLE